MQAFVRAADLGSLSAAARSLSSTQPTVSKHVSALEASLGVRLLERGPARVALTDEGARFLDSARRLLEDYAEAVADLDRGQREPHGRVRISAPMALGTLHLHRLMMDTRQRFPKLEIDLFLEDRFVDPLEERFDLTLRIGGPLPQDLAARRLAVWPRFVVASPLYLKSHPRPRKPSDLAQHEFLHYPSGEDAALKLSKGSDVVEVAVPVRYRVNNALALLDGIRGGAGLGLQPCWMVNELLKRGELVRVLPAWIGPRQEVWMIAPPRPRLPMRVRVMQDLITEMILGL
jgi:DNA-binding transcriptional LysR family regulator